MNGADYYDVTESNIVYSFSELPFAYEYRYINYQYATFQPFPYNLGYLRISNEVTNFTKYHNFIANTQPALFFGGIDVYFEQPVRNLSFTTAGANGGTFQVDIYKDRVFAERRIIHAYCGGYPLCTTRDLQSINNISGIIIHSINDAAGLGFDDFSFTLGGFPPTPTPTPNKTPVGNLDAVQPDGIVKGWTADPDNQSVSNLVKFYIDGQAATNLVGTIPANVPRTDIAYPGNHGFEFSIPVRFRDGVQHTVYAYGQDITAGQPATLLTGSPKTFNISPAVESTVMIGLPESPLTANPNSGGGLRIYPHKRTPTDTDNRSYVRIKAKISPAIAGVPVYFRSYDMDEPGTDSLPLDRNGTNSGDDNRISSFNEIYCAVNPIVNCSISPGNTYYAVTDGSGEAVIYFSVGDTAPGDNFAVAASTKETDVSQAASVGLAVRDDTTGKIFRTGIDRTEMLTAWRRLHVEVDSMGLVQYNLEKGKVGNSVVVQPGTSSRLTIGSRLLDPRRFEGGKMYLRDGNILGVKSNSNTDVSVFTDTNPISVTAGTPFSLYDDDDFNSDNLLNGFDADNGEDVSALPDTFSLMQENDDQDCSDGICNVFAAAYIVPEYSWATPYNTSDIPFVQNVSTTQRDTIKAQIERGRYATSGEDDDFWVVYVQIAYQPTVEEDCDPNRGACTAGISVGSIFDVDNVTNEAQVPTGSQGSLIFIESTRDGNDTSNNLRLKAAPHKIGHQFGINGDDASPFLMGYSPGLMFEDKHLNVIRWRRKSPGVPRV